MDRIIFWEFSLPVHLSHCSEIFHCLTKSSMLLIAVMVLYSPLVPQLPLGPVGQVLSIETSDSKSNVASILNQNSQSNFFRPWRWVVVDFNFHNLHKLSFSYFDTSRLKSSVQIFSQKFQVQKHRENLKVQRFLHRRNSAFCRRNNRFSILFLLQSGDHVHKCNF